ncbi:MAG: hypothetical protein FWE09_01735 [Treponema sp.]|nr:hypothetical protein [Treponema sp.]
MDNYSHASFMALHSHPIVESLAEDMRITKREALDLFYNSRLYRLYEREETKLWHFSTVMLVDLLRQEITTGHIEFPVEG